MKIQFVLVTHSQEESYWKPVVEPYHAEKMRYNE